MHLKMELLMAHNLILGLRTDKPEAELYLYDNEKLIDEYKWEAHRQLSDTLLIKIEELLNRNSLDLDGVSGIVVYQGPGSFTGLRIGITVANTLAYALDIPITGAVGDDWAADALQNLQTQAKPQIIIPEYGSNAHITKPRK